MEVLFLKKIFRRTCVPLLFLNLPLNVIQAQEVPEPYLVTQYIPNETIPMEECTVLLQNPMNDTTYNPSIDSTTMIQETEVLLQDLQNQFNQLNAEISQLESGELESLDWANSQLMLVIESLYEEYSILNEEFIYLSEEEQTNIIASHELVSEWQGYMQEIQAIINQKIADRDQIEQEYAQVNYSYNELLKEEEDLKELRNLYNQCQLYAYSSEYLSPDQILLNHESGLNDYLIQISEYLDKIIATPYRKIAFSDILQQFKQQLVADGEIFANKDKIVIDSVALQNYAYAKEINLADIETLSQQARLDFENDQDLTQYSDRYRELIQLKENQWNYIYQINSEAFEKLKNDLANFLNLGDYRTDNEIQLVSELQNKYQVKLVFFDELNQQWIINSTGTSGYYDQYYYEEFSLDVLDSSMNPLESEAELMSEEDSQIIDSFDETRDESESEEDQSSSMDDKLSSLKEQLSNARNNTQVKELTVPNSSSDIKGPPSAKATNKSKNVELPSTGEKRPLTVGAILLLIFGLILILTNSFSKRKKKDELLKIDLD